MNDKIHGKEIWMSNLITDSTFMIYDIFPGTGGSLDASVTTMAHIGYRLYFPANDSIHGNELGYIEFPALDIENISKINSTINTYPNPFKNVFYVDIPANLQACNISITDLLGRTIYSSPISDNSITPFKVDLELFSKGIYIVKVVTNKEVISEKIIKE